MSNGNAKVEIDTLKHLKLGLQHFCESVSVALGDGDSDLRRTLLWLELEARTHWANEIKKREKIVERCKEAVRLKSIFRDASGGRQSVVDEQKALKRAQQQLAVALEKAVNVKKYLGQLQKESLLYKGHVQRLTTSVSNDLPTAGHKLGAMIATLEQYAAVAPVEATSTAPAVSTATSMARPEELESPAPGENSRATEKENPDGHV